MKTMTFDEAVTTVTLGKITIPTQTEITDFDRTKYRIIQECENYKMYDYSDGVIVIEEFPEKDCSYLAILDSDFDDVGELGYCLTTKDPTVIMAY